MAYFDIDKKANEIMAPMSSSFMPRELPYLFNPSAGSETRVKFPFTTEWFQITNTSATTVAKFGFENGSTSGTYAALGVKVTSPVFNINCDELYVNGDCAIMAMCTNVLSGTIDYNLDQR